MENQTKQAETIRELNDRFRSGGSDVPGRIMITAGIQALTDIEGVNATFDSLMEQVRGFTAFDEDNDPYHEHDFGSLEFQGTKVFWKIDYYGLDLASGSDDPADTEKTIRVLTVMTASEY